ncbi:T7SS effector LXG polymorphic toxin [Pseudogracilibacillus auburnensis]|uniref:Putative ribonuclease toxin of YeeF-YezG toxin-antitoxin module n=1 Tax=Pseudogracilibacillus auburnensis TaxID=1494959 RepID=A0A2V3VPT1_9BACI|nr:T7SS effector LXG polymorphic toxin [Pseudogracilibacillus auburnensis]PXW83550.1 putative ribonuclease toxin of YeeF-YezG toxin-antitoxin module [Pseudogracilibacillus auburnensis]
MKVLDVNSLHKGIQSIHSEIETLHSQITALQRAVRGVTELDAELKGRTGESIRSFYNQIHQPILILLHQSLTDYAKVLDGIKGSIQAFEPNNHGYIDQDFMDGKLRDGLDTTEIMTNDLIEEINLELSHINDLISLDEMSMLELSQYLAQGHKKITTVMEGLYEVDHTGTKALSNVEKDLQLLKNYLSDMTISFKNDAAIPNYKALNAFEMGSYGEVWKKVYGNSTIKQNGLMDNVKDFVSDENSYKGVGLGLVDIGTDIVEGVIELFTNPMGVLSSVALFATAMQPNQIGLRMELSTYIGIAITKSYMKDVVHGDNESRARWFTYALGSVGIEVIGLKGAGAAIKAPGTMTKISNTMSKTASTMSKTRNILAETKFNQFDLSNYVSYSPKYQLAFDSYSGNVPYNVLDGKNLLNQVQNKNQNIFEFRGNLNNKGTGNFANKNFASRDLLESHYEKHAVKNNEFHGDYNNADEYMQGARDVMSSGTKVRYQYRGETRTGYVRFMGNSRKGEAKFEFVGTNANGDVTTYHVKRGKDLWKLLNNNKRDKTINPME